ncbi:MAG: hypothetical protein ABIQ32_03930 [Sphingomicrobium sp.]
MFYPPSLPDDVKSRAFRAGNGELGVLPADAPAFLAACKRDDVKVLGWELWVVDHDWDADTNSVVPASGCWSGLIPVKNYLEPAVIGGDGGADDAQEQLASVDLSTEVQPAVLSYIRVNFTL